MIIGGLREAAAPLAVVGDVRGKGLIVRQSTWSTR